MDLDQLLTQCRKRRLHVSFLPFPIPGAYYLPERLIIIDSRLSEQEQLATLAHEYIHACFWHDGHQSPEIEAAVNRRAAQLLVSPIEYVLAEKVYGGNVFLIAEELNLPAWVIRAYQETLLAGFHASAAMRAASSASLRAEECW